MVSAVSANFWHNGKLALARALNLDLTHSQCHYAAFLSTYVTDGVRWLDVGCGRQIVPFWAVPEAEQRTMVSRCACVVGVDADEAIRDHHLLTAKVKGMAGKLPFRSGAFDLLTANMVVEHVDDCQAFLADAFRVLRPGGRFVFHTPNYLHYQVFIASLVPDSIKRSIVWWLERRREQDRFRTYYRMNSVARIRHLAESSGFELEKVKVVGSNGSLGRLGPLGLLECFVLKTCSMLGHGRFNSNLVCALRKLSAADSIPSVGAGTVAVSYH